MARVACQASAQHTSPEFKMRPIFSENRQNSAGPNLKITDFWNSSSKILKKIKKSGKICKKTRSNYKNIGGECFFKSRPFCWIKFKLNQKYKNEPIWPTTHVYCIRSLRVGRTEDGAFPILSDWKRRQSRAEWEEIGGDGVKTGEIRPGIGQLSR
jgi:hypothetical protein